MLVDRCWFCLEQPAVTTVTLDGHACPACDVCAAEQAVKAATPAGDTVPDEVWARIVQDLR